MRKMFSEKQIETMIDEKVNGATINPSKIVISDIGKIKDSNDNSLIQVVEELPATPVANVIYLVKEV